MPPATPPAAPDRRDGRPCGRPLRAFLWLLLAAWLVLFVGWLSLHWLILPHIEEWRPTIEARASAMLGAPIRIGAISAQSSGWVPALELRDVRVLDAEQRVALTPAARLRRAVAALAARARAALRAAPDRRRRASTCDATRAAASASPASTSRAAQGAGDDDAAADWFFRQHEFVIRAGTLRWIDEARERRAARARRRRARRAQRPARRTTSASTRRRRRAGAIASACAAASTSRCSRAAATGGAGAAASTSTCRAPSCSELRRHVTLPFELSEGDGALRGWFELKDGQPTSASVDLALRAVALRLDKAVEPLQFEQLAGRIDAEKNDDRTSIAVQQLGFRTGDGLSWPQSDMRVVWRQDEAGDVDRRRVRRRAPRRRRDGRDRDARADRRGRCARCSPTCARAASSRSCARAGTGRSMRPRTIASRASSAISRSRPGRRPKPMRSAAPASATPPFSSRRARPAARRASTSQAGRLDLPGVFEEREVPLDRLDAKLSWKIEPRANAARRRR